MNSNHSELVTFFVCNCCGKVAQARPQPVLVPGSVPITQVECITEGCKNHYWTYSYREGEDNSQTTNLYTPMQMSADEAARFIKAVDFKVKGGV